MPREIKAGDCFLLPFKGARRDLLIRAVKVSPFSWQQWECEYVATGQPCSGYTLLTSCSRVGPAEVRRIIGDGVLGCDGRTSGKKHTDGSA